jgi:hypothetical protein
MYAEIDFALVWEAAMHCRRRSPLVEWGAFLLGLVGGGCGHPTPDIQITDPLHGSTVTIPANQQLPVSFTVTNFTLQAPGSCGTNARCGHVHARINLGPTCNAIPSNNPAPDPLDPTTSINAEGAASPITIDFTECGSMPLSGETWNLFLYLANDNDTDVLDSYRQLIGVESAITIR